jgi:acyl-CoA synthetase (AMP-forming)/AMP-acid ligase II
VGGNLLVKWLNLGQILPVNAKKFPDKLAFKDATKTLTFSEYNSRSNQLANGLLKLGLNKGDTVSVLSQNCIEFAEIYAATAKAGLIVNPINWRLVGKDIQYIVDNADSKAFFVGEPFIEGVNSIKDHLPKIPTDNYISISDKKFDGYQEYEKIVGNGEDVMPEIEVIPQDTWILLYTSGTTGVPKGVIRSHESYIAFFLINEVDYGFNEYDYGLIIMPFCHVNSTFYSFVFTYIGGSVYIHREFDFNPVEIFELIDREKVTFTSLIPTHYALMMAVPEEERNKYDLSSIKSLLCSSAPVRKQTKLDIMKAFPNAKLFEAYGSTEAGLVTLLKPDDQLKKLGSIGQECAGTDILKILDESGNEVPVGEVGELYSRGPMMFDEYYKLPDKTQSSFIGDFFSAGDMVKKDDEGYYYIVDRKDNMIITGGEHVYPSEVEDVIASHPDIFDVAVIGVPHDKWGEAVMAIAILKDGANVSEDEIINFCRNKMAGYKKPKAIKFITQEEMPRTASGKILHRILREQYTLNE